MKIITLGTNGWYTTETGETICTLLETEEYYVVLDSGNAIRKLDRHVKDFTKPLILLLSHLHLDHIHGVHILSKFHFDQGMTVYAQKKAVKLLKRLIDHPFTVPPDELPMKVVIRELLPGKSSIPFPVTVLPLDHPDPCIGFRMELDDKIIVYCTDTGDCENLRKLAERADVLITECSWLPGFVNSSWPHLNPETAAKIASEVGVKKLVLTHFGTEEYPTIERRKNAEGVAKQLFVETVAAVDDMVIPVNS
ncbi:MAG: MBL fold metallo-hydrolase [Candidatus Odinarchaeota archaeon]